MVAEMTLHHAAKNGDVVKMRRLVAAGVDVDELDEGGVTALLWAALNGHVEAMRLLVVDLGANKEAKTADGLTALHLALSRAALRRRGWGHTASVCTYAMYLASSYAPQARGGQAVSSAVTAQSCLALRGRLPTDGLGPPERKGKTNRKVWVGGCLPERTRW